MKALASLRQFLHGLRRSARPVIPLSPLQARWIGILLLAAQIPQAPYLSPWIAALGLGLVVLRLVLGWRDPARFARPLSQALTGMLSLFAVAVAVGVYATYGMLFGREPSVAFLFVLCGIKYCESRTSRDGTLLACLAAFLLITPFLSNQSIFAAVAVLPALWILIGSLEVLARPASLGPGPVAWRAPLKRATVIVLQGLPIAAVAFLLFPRLAGPLWGMPGDRGAHSGLSDSMEPGEVSELSLSDDVAFRVDFDGAIPLPAERYWRGPVLSNFNGRKWTTGMVLIGGTFAPPASRTVSYTVTLEPHNHPWLFALDLPTELPQVESGSSPGAPGAVVAGLTLTQQLVTRGPVNQTLRYTQTSSLRASFPPASAGELRQNLRLTDANPRAVAFARELRARQPDDRSYIAAILAHFHDQPFVYTLSPTALSGDPVDRFLFDTQRGFCEHYASAFVVLLRAAGIPARVVTGYQGGEMNPNGGYMIVRQSDAHAWAEAMVDGAWRRFDPTAAVAPSRVERGIGGALPASEPLPMLARLEGSWLKDVRLSLDAINHEWRRHVVDFNFARQQLLWREWKIDRYAAWQIVAGVGLFVGLWGAAVLAWFAQKRRRQERALLLWDTLCRHLARAGLPREPWEGPVAFAQRAAKRWPQFAIALSAMGETYAALRYGGVAGRERERAALLATLEHTIDALPAPRVLRRAPQAG